MFVLSTHDDFREISSKSIVNKMVVIINIFIHLLHWDINNKVFVQRKLFYVSSFSFFQCIKFNKYKDRNNPLLFFTRGLITYDFLFHLNAPTKLQSHFSSFIPFSLFLFLLKEILISQYF